MFGTRQSKKNNSQDMAAPLASLNKAMTRIEDSLAQDVTDTESRNSVRTKQSAPQNIIGKGTVIDGNLIAEGDLIVEGTVRGDVATKATLMVSPTAVIEGNIAANHAEVSGRVNGTVQAFGLLIIKASGIIDGDVITKNLNVESGSTFNGRFKVGGTAATGKQTDAAHKQADLEKGLAAGK